MTLPPDPLEERETPTLVTARMAAEITGRQPVTVRRWVSKGWLRRAGVDRYGAFLYHRHEVWLCERAARERRSPGRPRRVPLDEKIGNTVYS